MKVRLLIGANAYACITEHGMQHDIRLESGKHASKSLRSYAESQRLRAKQAIESAERAERAANVLEDM